MHFTVLPDGEVKFLAKVAKGTEQITVVLVKDKAGDRAFTPWDMSYVVPPEVQLEAVWTLTQRLVKTHKFPNVICGVVGKTFRWGWFETLSGISARQRVMPGQGGLIPEFYCLARANNLSPSDARALAIKQAATGEACEIPNGDAT